MKLRNYQESSQAGVFACFETNRSCLVVLPTGCGKTVVFADIIKKTLERKATKDHSPRAMILAHREELVNQAAEKVRRVTGVDVGIEMGEMHVSDFLGKAPPVVVSTVQTQNTGRMYGFDPSEFDLLVIDEAHHATSKSYRACIDHYLSNPNCRLLGVTATPDRADEHALGTVFEKVAFEYSVVDAIDDGWLVPIRQRLVKVGSLDFSGISTTAGDFNQGELSELMQQERNLHGIARPTMDICGERRAIVFATSVKQAEQLAEILNRYGSQREKNPVSTCAAWLCGKTDKEERRQILADFKSGRIQFVVNCGVLTEGFDDAGVEVVVMARPTKSRALYAQMAGRATRPAAEIAAKLGEVGEIEVEKRGGISPEGVARAAKQALAVCGQWNLTSCSAGQQNESGNSAIHHSSLIIHHSAAAAARRQLIAHSSKPSCLIVDFVGNSGRHKLCTTADILGGKDDDEMAEARERALRTCVESGAETDMAGEIAKAREEIRAEKEREAKRRAFITATAKYVEITVDPFNIFDLPPVEKLPPDQRGRRLSWKQREMLRDMGVDPDRVSDEAGQSLLNEKFRRIKSGLASYNQLKYLRRRGIPVPMTFAEAGKTIERLAS